MPITVSQPTVVNHGSENPIAAKKVQVQSGITLRQGLARIGNLPSNVAPQASTGSQCCENRALDEKCSSDKEKQEPTARGLEPRTNIRSASILKSQPRPVQSRRGDEVVFVSRSASYLSEELVVPQLPSNIPDIDEDDLEHLEFCSELVKHAYAYLYRLENTQLVRPGFISRHPELRPSMRSILIDWLVSVQQKFKLLQETLFISVMYLDRFLADTSFNVSRSRLQLVGVACMLLACKYEEMYLPSVSDFVYMCDNAYKREEILKMERMVLCALKFELGRPICSHFLRRYSKAAGSDSTCHTIAKYLMEVSLYDYELSSEKPSVIAAACLLLAGKATTCIRWDEVVEFYSSYTEEDLLPTASRIARLASTIDKNKHMRATYKKYTADKFSRVADICLQSSVFEAFN